MSNRRIEWTITIDDIVMSDNITIIDAEGPTSKLPAFEKAVELMQMQIDEKLADYKNAGH